MNSNRLIALLLVCLTCILSMYLYVDLAEKPQPCVFTIRPIERHAKLAVSLMQNGDTLHIVRDGKKHYWTDGIVVGTNLTNATFNLDVHWCVGGDSPDCDVVIPQNIDLLYWPSAK